MEKSHSHFEEMTGKMEKCFFPKWTFKTELCRFIMEFLDRYADKTYHQRLAEDKNVHFYLLQAQTSEPKWHHFVSDVTLGQAPPDTWLGIAQALYRFAQK